MSLLCTRVDFREHEKVLKTRRHGNIMYIFIHDLSHIKTLTGRNGMYPLTFHNPRISVEPVLIKYIVCLKGVNRRSSGRYCCEATNKVGTGKSPPFHLRIKFEPVCGDGSARKVLGAAKDEPLRIECKVNQNLNVLINWFWSWCNKFGMSLIPLKVHGRIKESKLCDWTAIKFQRARSIFWH